MVTRFSLYVAMHFEDFPFLTKMEIESFAGDNPATLEGNDRRQGWCSFLRNQVTRTIHTSIEIFDLLLTR